MSGTNLCLEEDFLVKESKTINYVAGGIMVAVFIASLIIGDYGWSNYLWGLGLFLVPGAVYLAKGNRNTTIIRINKTGFYYREKLVTDWNHFYGAAIRDKTAVGRYRDNFVLELRYYALDYTKVYTESFPLTNTQDKAEEEIIEAINFYYNAGKLTSAGLPEKCETEKEGSEHGL
jgi:hypothetical protein